MTADLATLRHQVRARRDLPAPPMRRAIRQAAGISLEAIAEHVGCSRQAVAHWERGDRYPRAEHLRAYADVLRVLQESAQ